MTATLDSPEAWRYGKGKRCKGLQHCSVIPEGYVLPWVYFAGSGENEQFEIIIPTLGNIRLHFAVRIAAMIRQVHAATQWKIVGDIGGVDVKLCFPNKPPIYTIVL
jgi:hypothetical protein